MPLAHKNSSWVCLVVFSLEAFVICPNWHLPLLMDIVITGASSGIGTEATRVLALRGVHVIMAVRNMAAAGEVKEAIVKEIPAAKVEAMELDLSSMESVKKFASEFNSSGLPLNILM